MNIFKVLSNGDGSINEPNVSAFLGYLLDHNADHGLGDSFLSRFINSISGEEKYSTNSEYKIFYEQGFKSEGVKDIVDLVLLEYSENIKNGKETQFHGFVESEKRKIENIYLIENKIRVSSKKDNQLINQYIKTKNYLEKIQILEKDRINTVFITPFEKEDKKNDLVKEFKKFKEEYPGSNAKHLFWNNGDDNIKDLLIKLLDDEVKYIIDPISEFTKQIIKSFIQFIESDFKSEVQEKKDKKQNGEYISEFIELNKASEIESKLHELKVSLEKINPNLIGSLSEPDLKEQRFPCLHFRVGGVVIRIEAGTKKRDTINFYFRIDKNNYDDSNLIFKKLADKMGIEIKNAKNKNREYFKTEKMNINIKISDVNNVNNTLIELIENVNKI